MKNKNENNILVADVKTINENKNKTLYRDELEIFYRETGQKNDNKPNVLPGHGFRSLSPMYRNQMIAPDYSNYGNNESQPVTELKYSFDQLLLDFLSGCNH